MPCVWRFDPAASGGGLFFDRGSHTLDLVDFLAAPIREVSGTSWNTGGTYAAEDVTVASYIVESNVPGTGVWNFNADASLDRLRFVGAEGHLVTPIFIDGDVVITRDGKSEVHAVRNPPHVHQPLIQTIVDELNGRGRCESTGDSGARTSWVMDRCVATYYWKRGQSSFCEFEQFRKKMTVPFLRSATGCDGTRRGPPDRRRKQ